MNEIMEKYPNLKDTHIGIHGRSGLPMIYQVSIHAEYVLSIQVHVRWLRSD